MTEPFKYQGSELELFQHANNWKRYFSGIIRPTIKGDVLEVGAGIGSTTLLLNDGSASTWLLLEPDDAMSENLAGQCREKQLPSNCRVIKGTTAELTGSFDTIIYIDVLEHIENDRAELERASALLKPRGHLVVLSPAFQHLFSPFDKAIGHYRRYTRATLKKITPPELRTVSIHYYDSIGYFASVMNKLLLRQRYPRLRQVKFWDRWLMPLSRISDKIFLHSFGKSIIATWQKEPQK